MGDKKNELYFSIVMPAYNVEKVINRTLSSLISQSYKKFEIILIDDGSQDNSIEVINSFIKDNRNMDIRLITIKNSGAPTARNIGIKQAKYEWIAFLDADDEFTPNKLELFAKVIKNNDTINLISSNFKEINGIKTVLFDNYLKYDPNISLFVQLYKKGCLLGGASMVAVKKDILNEVDGFTEGMKSCQDYDLWVRLSLSKNVNFKILQNSLVNYYVSENNISSNILNRLNCNMDLIRKYYKNLHTKVKFPYLVYFYRMVKFHLSAIRILIKR